MSFNALWLDHQHAYIYTFTAEGVEEKKLKSHGNEHDKNNIPDKFFHEVANALSGTQELFIMGPGVAKEQFKHHCENHKHNNLAKAIVGLASMESHPSKAEMIAKANEFFSKHHMWTKNY